MIKLWEIKDYLREPTSSLMLSKECLERRTKNPRNRCNKDQKYLIDRLELINKILLKRGEK